MAKDVLSVWQRKRELTNLTAEWSNSVGNPSNIIKFNTFLNINYKIDVYVEMKLTFFFGYSYEVIGRCFSG